RDLPPAAMEPPRRLRTPLRPFLRACPCRRAPFHDPLAPRPTPTNTRAPPARNIPARRRRAPAHPLPPGTLPRRRLRRGRACPDLPRWHRARPKATRAAAAWTRERWVPAPADVAPRTND